MKTWTRRSIGPFAGVLIAGLCLAVLVGCSEKEPPPAAPAATGVINATCPIMGNPVNQANTPPELVRQYKGKRIGFCCAGCPGKWDQLPDDKKDELLAKAKG